MKVTGITYIRMETFFFLQREHNNIKQLRILSSNETKTENFNLAKMIHLKTKKTTFLLNVITNLSMKWIEYFGDLSNNKKFCCL